MAFLKGAIPFPQDLSPSCWGAQLCWSGTHPAGTAGTAGPRNRNGAGVWSWGESIDWRTWNLEADLECAMGVLNDKYLMKH